MKRPLRPNRSNGLNEGMLVRSNIPQRYWKVQLDAISGSPPFKEKINDYCLEIAKNIEERRGIYIFGRHGSGKTSLAVFVMKEVLMHAGKTYFLPARDITEVYYSNLMTPADHLSGESVPVKERLRECHLVVLDDLGAESWNPQKAGGAELERFLREQYESMGTVIITGVIPPAELGNRYTQPVQSLIQRMTRDVKVASSQWT